MGLCSGAVLRGDVGAMAPPPVRGRPPTCRLQGSYIPGKLLEIDPPGNSSWIFEGPRKTPGILGLLRRIVY